MKKGNRIRKQLKKKLAYLITIGFTLFSPLQGLTAVTVYADEVNEAALTEETGSQAAAEETETTVEVQAAAAAAGTDALAAETGTETEVSAEETSAETVISDATSAADTAAQAEETAETATETAVEETTEAISETAVEESTEAAVEETAAEAVSSDEVLSENTVEETEDTVQAAGTADELEAESTGEAVTITLDDSSATLSKENSGVSFKNDDKGAGVVTISQNGSYILTGSGKNIYITANKKLNLSLTLDSLTIDDSGLNTLEGSNKAIIELKNGCTADITLTGDSNLTGGTGSGDDSEEYEPLIGAKAGNITFSGDGSLTLNNAPMEGIKAKEGKVNITSGTINIDNSSDDAIKAKDGSVNISGGKVNITNCNGDGIQAENVDISAGTVNIQTVYANASTSYYSSTIKAVGTDYSLNNIVESGSTKTEYINVDTGSHKAIKAGTKAETAVSADTVTKTVTEASGSLKISGGTITIDTTGAGLKANSVNGSYNKTSTGVYIIGSPDDAIHSNNTLDISGGTINIASSDDGINSLGALNITGTPVINITRAYEGIESPDISIGTSGASNGPEITIDSNDDGINASGKTVTYYYTDDENEDCYYRKVSTSKSGNSCEVFSGKVIIRIDSEGSKSTTLAGNSVSYGSSGDGIDCNGSLSVYGGEVYVYGQSSGDNNPIDVDDTFTLNSTATLLMTGVGSGESLPEAGGGVYVYLGNAAGGPGGTAPGGAPSGQFGSMSAESDISANQAEDSISVNAMPGGGNGFGGGTMPGGNDFGGGTTPGGNDFGGGTMPGGNDFGGGTMPGGGAAASIAANSAFTVANGNTTIYTGTLPYSCSFVLFASPKLTSGTSYTLTAGSTSTTSTATAAGTDASGGGNGGSGNNGSNDGNNGNNGGSSEDSGSNGNSGNGSSGNESSGTTGGSTSSDNVTSGLDGRVVTVSGDEANTYIAYMVKGQKYSFGSGAWSSSSSKVVSVTKKAGTATAKKQGVAILTNSESNETIRVIVYAPELSSTKETLLIGDTAKVTLKNIDNIAQTWVTTAPMVAKVDVENNDGDYTATITAVGKGTAKIIAYAGTKAYTVKVTVRDTLTGTTIDGSEGDIKLNAFQTLKKIKYSNGFKAKGAVWTESGSELSKDEKGYWYNDIVRISKSGAIYAKAVGETAVTGTNNGTSVTLTIKVSAVPVRSVIYLNKGQKVSLKNTYVKNSGAVWTASGSNISLSNSDKAKVTIEGVTVGETSLQCTYNGVTYTTAVFVEDPSLTTDDSLTATGSKKIPYALTLKAGSSYTINQPGVFQTVTWRSSKSLKAFADENAVIHAREAGTSVISTTVNKKTIKIKVTVTE